MESLILISTVLVIHIFAWFTPGPLFVLIIRNSLMYSRKSGIWTAVGIGIGNAVHITYSLVGLALIISTSSIAFNIIKYLGVSYLVYLGIKTFLTKVDAQKINSKTKQHKDLTPFHAAKTGFLTNILSPKASLFFASIFASVMASSPPLWVIIFLGVAMPLNSVIIASILSVFFTQIKVRSVYSNYQHIVNKLLAVALITLAVIIAFS